MAPICVRTASSLAARDFIAADAKATAHSAKGREWDAVFVIWAVDGYFPLSRALGSGLGAVVWGTSGNDTFTVTAGGANHTITVNNPALLPQMATNWDATLDYYFEPVGNLSIGWFHKKIKDYIVDVVCATREVARK